MAENRTRAVYRRYVNDPSTIETDLHERTGQQVAVTPVPLDTYDYYETGLMYSIVFDDGYASTAFADELTFIAD